MKEVGHHLIDHTADFGLELWAPAPERLFRYAGQVLFQLVADSRGRLTGRHKRSLSVEGEDWADLMVNWLRELLFLWNGQGEIAADIVLESLAATHLRATLTTDDFNPEFHLALHEIKAVTYHQIQVGPCAKGWCARVIFDV
ncbi:MAG: archease [Desulfosarcinaceae bacterium]